MYVRFAPWFARRRTSACHRYSSVCRKPAEREQVPARHCRKRPAAQHLSIVCTRAGFSSPAKCRRLQTAQWRRSSASWAHRQRWCLAVSPSCCFAPQDRLRHGLLSQFCTILAYLNRQNHVLADGHSNFVSAREVGWMLLGQVDLFPGPDVTTLCLQLCHVQLNLSVTAAWSIAGCSRPAWVSMPLQILRCASDSEEAGLAPVCKPPSQLTGFLLSHMNSGATDCFTVSEAHSWVSFNCWTVVPTHLMCCTGFGAAYGTAKAGVGIASMGVLRCVSPLYIRGVAASGMYRDNLACLKSDHVGACHSGTANDAYPLSLLKCADSVLQARAGDEVDCAHCHGGSAGYLRPHHLCHHQHWQCVASHAPHFEFVHSAPCSLASSS